jgi:hypothetical protein
MLPEDADDCYETTHIDFVIEAKNVISNEADMLREQIDQILHISMKTNLERLGLCRDNLNRETKELMNKITFIQNTNLNQIDCMRNAFDERIKSVVDQEQNALALIKSNTNDLAEMRLNAKILKQCVLSIKKIK